MGRNATSPEQDFSSWDVYELDKYSCDLDKSSDRRDARIRKKVLKIVSQKLKESPICQFAGDKEISLPSSLKIPTKDELITALHLLDKFSEYGLPFRCVDDNGNIVYVNVETIRQSKDDYIKTYKQRNIAVLGIKPDFSDDQIWDKLSGGYQCHEQSLPIIGYKGKISALTKHRKFYILPVRKTG